MWCFLVFQTHPQINNTSVPLWIFRRVVYASHAFSHSKWPRPLTHSQYDIFCQIFHAPHSFERMNYLIIFSFKGLNNNTIQLIQNTREPSQSIFCCDLGEPSFTPCTRVLTWERNQMQRYRNQRFASDYQPVSFAGKRDSSIAFCMRSRAVWGNVCLFSYSASTVRKECSY